MGFELKTSCSRGKLLIARPQRPHGRELLKLLIHCKTNIKLLKLIEKLISSEMTSEMINRKID